MSVLESATKRFALLGRDKEPLTELHPVSDFESYQVPVGKTAYYVGYYPIDSNELAAWVELSGHGHGAGCNIPIGRPFRVED